MCIFDGARFPLHTGLFPNIHLDDRVLPLLSACRESRQAVLEDRSITFRKTTKDKIVRPGRAFRPELDMVVVESYSAFLILLFFCNVRKDYAEHVRNLVVHQEDFYIIIYMHKDELREVGSQRLPNLQRLLVVEVAGNKEMTAQDGQWQPSQLQQSVRDLQTSILQHRRDLLILKGVAEDSVEERLVPMEVIVAEVQSVEQVTKM